MRTFEFRRKRYALYADGFPLDAERWDEDFAKAVAEQAGITRSLSESHWGVISLIRDRIAVTGKCPKVCDVCKAQYFYVAGLRQSFTVDCLR